MRVHARLLRPPRAVAGPTLMLHGLGVSAASLGPLAEILARRSLTLVPDLPGFGRSEAREVWTTARIAAAAARLLEARGLGPVVVVGHSYGCHVGVLLARRRPELVSALVMLSPAFARPPGSALGQVVRLAADAPLERPSLVAGGVRDYLRAGPGRVVRTLREAARLPLDGLVAGLAPPLLVVRGGRDPLTPARWAERLRACAPRAEVATIPRAAHGLGHDAPAATAGAVERFLGRDGHPARMARLGEPSRRAG